MSDTKKTSTTKTSTALVKNDYYGHGYWRLSVSIASRKAIEYLERKKGDGVNYSRIINSALLEYINNHADSTSVEK